LGLVDLARAMAPAATDGNRFGWNSVASTVAASHPAADAR